MLRRVLISALIASTLPCLLLGQDRFDEVTVRAGLDRQFSDLDSNDDEQLNEMELGAFPKPELEMFRSHGLGNDFPISRSDFVGAGVATAMALFQAREPESSETDDGRSKDEMKKTAPQLPPAAAVPSRGGFRKGRYVPVLPPEYAARDKNGDGQIGLYEWERKRYSEFAKLDKNGDGFLTPAELVSKETLQAIYSRSAKDGADPTKGVGSISAATPALGSAQFAGSRPAGPLNSPSAAGGSANPIDEEARGAFARLDENGNRDGQLDEAEWARSRTTRSMFEASGTKVPLPVKVDAFVELYRKAKTAGGRS